MASREYRHIGTVKPTRQNQSRSTPEASSMVRKSRQEGRLNFQRVKLFKRKVKKFTSQMVSRKYSVLRVCDTCWAVKNVVRLCHDRHLNRDHSLQCHKPHLSRNSGIPFATRNIRKLFNPSSIQVHWRSSEFTIIGK